MTSTVTVWVVLSIHGIVGPVWFEEENGQAETVASRRYKAILQRFWAVLQRRQLEMSWFMQDGSTPHIHCKGYSPVAE